MAENTKTKSRREQFGERLKGKYPDREFADDEALFGQIDDDYAEYDNAINTYKDRENKIVDIFTNNPKAANLFTAIARGESPLTSLIKAFGIDGVTDLLNNPEKADEHAKAHEEFVQRVAKEKEFDEEVEKNTLETTELLQKVKEEKGLSDETIAKIIEFVKQVAIEFALMKITPETIDMALKAINHDADMTNARTEGEIAGRNAKIEEKLRKPQGGDGMPTMGGGASNTPKERKPLNVFDYAEAAS
jgi:hypothetical protein